MSEISDAFIVAWKAHDEHPGDPIRTNRRIDATRAFAEEIGMTSVHAQDVLVAWRRTGFSYEQSVNALVSGVQSGKVS